MENGKFVSLRLLFFFFRLFSVLRGGETLLAEGGGIMGVSYNVCQCV